MAQLYSVWHALGVLQSILVLHSITTFSKSANPKCKEKCYCTPSKLKTCTPNSALVRLLHILKILVAYPHVVHLCVIIFLG